MVNITVLVKLWLKDWNILQRFVFCNSDIYWHVLRCFKCPSTYTKCYYYYSHNFKIKSKESYYNKLFTVLLFYGWLPLPCDHYCNANQRFESKDPKALFNVLHEHSKQSFQVFLMKIFPVYHSVILFWTWFKMHSSLMSQTVCARVSYLHCQVQPFANFSRVCKSFETSNFPLISLFVDEKHYWFWFLRR